MKLLRLLILSVALCGLLHVGLSLTSCSNTGCTENRNAVPLAEFFNSTTGQTVGFDSIEITGIGQPTDSVLSEAGDIITQVYLPMRPTHNSVAWCFAYKWEYLDYPELNDTIEFVYDSTPFFASADCGAYYKYHITEMTYTSHLIDRVEITDSLITNIDKVYVNIYFRVQSDDK